MKKTLTLLFSSLFLLLACNKDDDPTPTPVNPADQLPPATQTGEVMLACTVNGVPYITKGYDQVTSYYQWVNGGYGFIIAGRKETDLMWQITIGNSGNAPIEQGKTYPLNSNNPGHYGGGKVIGGPDNHLNSSVTNTTYTGELTITKFDLQNEIVSGTFWFDIENPWTGKKIEVRNGRFDTHFSQ